MNAKLFLTLQPHILTKYLDLPVICRLASICRDLSHALDSNVVWEEVFSRLFCSEEKLLSHRRTKFVSYPIDALFQREWKQSVRVWW